MFSRQTQHDVRCRQWKYMPKVTLFVTKPHPTAIIYFHLVSNDMGIVRQMTVYFKLFASVWQIYFSFKIILWLYTVVSCYATWHWGQQQTPYFHCTHIRFIMIIFIHQNGKKTHERKIKNKVITKITLNISNEEHINRH